MQFRTYNPHGTIWWIFSLSRPFIILYELQFSLFFIAVNSHFPSKKGVKNFQSCFLSFLLPWDRSYYIIHIAAKLPILTLISMISKQSKGAWNSSNVFAFLLHHYVGPHLKDPTAAAKVIVYKSCGNLSLLHIVGCFF